MKLDIADPPFIMENSIFIFKRLPTFSERKIIEWEIWQGLDEDDLS